LRSKAIFALVLS